MLSVFQNLPPKHVALQSVYPSSFQVYVVLSDNAAAILILPLVELLSENPTEEYLSGDGIPIAILLLLRIPSKSDAFLKSLLQGNVLHFITFIGFSPEQRSSGNVAIIRLNSRNILQYIFRRRIPEPQVTLHGDHFSATNLIN